ncbi:hypothetical protein RJ55_08674 [Drechmeria coniospora]|nr:hypothetical protein RJ55_08674 [Drechmeria coniospora]
MTVPSKTKQWTTAFDGVDKLQLGEADVPEPKAGEVLVRIEAVSLNYRDVEVCRGAYNQPPSPLAPAAPLVPCSDMCGTVIVSSEPLLPPGTRVVSVFLQLHLAGPLAEHHLSSSLGHPLPGVLTQHRLFRAESLVRPPGHLSAEEASCLPLAAVTAWAGLSWQNPLGRPLSCDGNETVLFQGTGAVSLAGLQIARAAGFRTIITSSSDAQLRRARDAGVDCAINHRTHWEWREPVLAATQGRGADVIFDTGRGRTLRKAFETVAFGGVINCIGYRSGEDREDVDGDKPPRLQRLDVDELALSRSVTLRAVVDGGKDRFEEMLRFYDRHQIKPFVAKVFPFAHAKEALQSLAEGEEHFGKVVIKMTE